MSIQLEIYVINEARLPIDPSGTDQERYERLVLAVRQYGAHWHEISSSGHGLILALEAVDVRIGGRKFLPIFAFNNSPSNVLGNAPDCPDFGYFHPEAAADLALLLQRLAEDDIQKLSDESELYADVYWNFRDAAEEAQKRGHAVAVLHDAPSAETLRGSSADS